MASHVNVQRRSSREEFVADLALGLSFGFHLVEFLYPRNILNEKRNVNISSTDFAGCRIYTTYYFYGGALA